MPLLSQAVGAAVVLLTLLDVFFTVLFPASGHGPIRNPLASAVWRCFRLIGSMITGQRRRNLLSYSGPVLFTITFIVWFLLLVTGWAMIYKPALGTAITASSGPTMPDWATAIYYSGIQRHDARGWQCRSEHRPLPVAYHHRGGAGRCFFRYGDHLFSFGVFGTRQP